MSWQATAWALRQKVGSPARKLTLLAVANYADENGECWPSQGRLAEDTEQSVDTVQRHIKKLIAMGLMRVAVRPQGRGRWSGRTYFLNIDVAEMSKPQSAARSDEREGVNPDHNPDTNPQTIPHVAAHHAAPETATMPQPERPPCRTAMRHEPSIEPPSEPSSEPSGAALLEKPSAADRRRAFQQKREGVEIIQNRIAQRLGPDGWLILGNMSDVERDQLTSLEEAHRLTPARLANLISKHGREVARA